MANLQKAPNSNLELDAIAQLRRYYESGTDIEENGAIKHLNPGIRSQTIMRVVRRMLMLLFKDLVRSV